jgi:hypothetical protein
VIYLNARKKRLPAAWKRYVERVGLLLKSSVSTLKSAPNIKWICVNFSSVHRKAKTEVWAAFTFMFWAIAVALQLIHHFEKEDIYLVYVVIEILVGAVCAAGFGWHLNELVALHRMEKRGELRPLVEELRKT